MDYTKVQQDLGSFILLFVIIASCILLLVHYVLHIVVISRLAHKKRVGTLARICCFIPGVNYIVLMAINGISPILIVLSFIVPFLDLILLLIAWGREFKAVKKRSFIWPILILIPGISFISSYFLLKRENRSYKESINEPKPLIAFLFSLVTPIGAIIALFVKKWSRETKLTYILLWIVWPIGLYYLLKYSKWSYKTKYSALVGLIFQLIFSISIIVTPLISSFISGYKDLSEGKGTLLGEKTGVLMTVNHIESIKNLKAREYFVESNLSRKSGDSYEALDSLLRAESLEPNNRAIQSNKCLLFIGLNRLDEAIQICDRELKYQPNSIYTVFNLAGAYYKKGDCENTLKTVNMLLTIEITEMLSDYDRNLFSRESGVMVFRCDGDLQIAGRLIKAGMNIEDPEIREYFESYEKEINEKNR